MPASAQSKYATPEEAREAVLASKRASAERRNERLRLLTPLERTAWKARDILGEDFDPYTPEERDRLLHLRDLQERLEEEAQILNSLLKDRLRREMRSKPELAVLLAEVEAGPKVRVDLKPY